MKNEKRKNVKFGLWRLMFPPMKTGSQYILIESGKRGWPRWGLLSNSSILLDRLMSVIRKPWLSRSKKKKKKENVATTLHEKIIKKEKNVYHNKPW